jgi:membrane-bound inhibitor of C-type lysozyme
MPASLLDSLNSLVTPELLSTASRTLGEPENVIGAGLAASFPTILAGLAARAGNAPAMRGMFDLICNPSNDSVARAPHLATAAGPNSPLGVAGGSLVSELFGAQLSSVGDAVARATGVSSATGGSLLRLAAPLVLGVLANRVRIARLDAAGMASLLLAERDQIIRALPTRLATIPGLGAVLGLTDVERSADDTEPIRTATTNGGARWLRPWLVALLLVVALWGLSRARVTGSGEGTVAAMRGPGSEADYQAAATLGGALRYRCGEQRVSLSQTGSRTVLSADAGVFEMRRVEAASGAKYEAFSDEATTFWSKGDRALLTIKGKPYPECATTP